MNGLRRQEPAAFAQLVQAHQGIVMGLGQSLGLRGADLDDAAAEAFAAVYRALPRFEGKSELGTWIYRITWRVIVKARQKRRRELVAPLPAEAGQTEEPGPSDAVEQSETAELIWAAVESLDPRQAAAIELYYRRDWPIERIAAMLECPAGTVKTLLYRARRQLKEMLSAKEVYP